LTLETSLGTVTCPGGSEVTGHLISNDTSTDDIELFQAGGPLDEKSELVGVLIASWTGRPR
jgi:hypothetical protein